MAKKKSKVPTPPRQVQAPRRRTEPRAAQGPRSPRAPRDPRQTKLFLGVVGGGVVAAVAIVIVLVTSGGGGGGGGKLGAAALAGTGCVAQEFPPLGRQHVLQVKKSFRYKSFPPTSGPHYPQPAIWNIYDQPVEQFRLVHNLEHGGVIVQYGDKVSRTQVSRIVAWYSADPDAMVVAPLPQLGGKIALTAWTHLMTCSRGFSEQAFTSFRDAYRGKGPEGFPVSALKPGT